ncbi:MAG: acetoin utilization protein AcuC [Candidatus Hodarchaeota archaeon]
MVGKVALIYTDKYQAYNFGPHHPLRPLRLKLTYSLMEKLELLSNEKLEIIEPKMATKEEIERIHASDYVNIVSKLSKNPNDSRINGVIPGINTPLKGAYVYGLGPGDNPIFKGMYEASALVCGASITAADLVWKENDFQIAFNLAGGMHHAIKDRASGFCIFNDIAVAIAHLKALKKDIRVAYLDIDCHHGDGVQWLFYNDPNVLKISFHESGRFLFPGTGNIDEIGDGPGEGFSINFPLLPGTNNRMFLKLFRFTVPRLLKLYSPDVLFTQLGVDTYFNDPLTQMGLSISVYRDIAQTMRSCVRDYCQNRWIAVGGGGYLMNVVPRAWTLFLAKMLDIELKNELPQNWIDEVKQLVPYEETPYQLWDQNDKAEIQLLSHPEITKKMIDYNNDLKAIFEEKFLPKLESSIGIKN